MTKEDDIAQLEKQIWQVMTRVSHRRFGDEIAKAAGYNLAPASWSLLEYLGRSGALRVSELAAYSAVDMSSVTPRLKKLEADGFIVRGNDPDDKRVSLISIGDAGRIALDRMRTARQARFAEVLKDIPAGEIAGATAVLAAIAESL